MPKCDFNKRKCNLFKHAILNLSQQVLSNGLSWENAVYTVNPFAPNAPFLHPLKTLENRKVF